MILFRGLFRKCSILPLSAVVVGWVVYLVGFILLMVKTSSKFDHLPYYVSAATPPILLLLGLLHAAFSGLASSTLGLLASLLSVVCFSSVGYVLYICSLELYVLLHSGTGWYVSDVKCILMFVGTLVMSLSWTLTLMLWNYFTYKQCNDFLASGYVDGNTSYMTSPISKNPPPFAGIARKLAGLLLVLKAGSWCLLITGMDSMIHVNASTHHVHDIYKETDLLPFGTWAVCTMGMLLVISATMHAAANGRASMLMGALTSLLSMLYLICIGHLVYSLSIRIYHEGVDAVSRYELYQLSGGIGTGVFWAGVLALWPFYYKTPENSHINIEQRGDVNQDPDYERLPLVYQFNKPTDNV